MTVEGKVLSKNEVWLGQPHSKKHGSLHDKLRWLSHFPYKAGTALDVGCSDGQLTLVAAKEFPLVHFTGIDLDPRMVGLATVKAADWQRPNTHFKVAFLRDLLRDSIRFDAVLFFSVLHEIFSYGSGLTSVIKALCDAKELLKPGGRIIIRDMGFRRMAGIQGFCSGTIETIRQRALKNVETESALEEFEERFGHIDRLQRANHFLLKYIYKENWDFEMEEDYLGVCVEDYCSLFSLLEMKVLEQELYLLPFLRDRWIKDFELDPLSLGPLTSTFGMVVEKQP